MCPDGGRAPHPSLSLGPALSLMLGGCPGQDPAQLATFPDEGVAAGTPGLS